MSEPMTETDLAAIRASVEHGLRRVMAPALSEADREHATAVLHRSLLLDEVDRLRAELGRAENGRDRADRQIRHHLDAASEAVLARRSAVGLANRYRADRDALAARLDAFLEPHTIVRRNIAWTDDGGELHVTEHSVCGHCVPEYAHFHRREDIPEAPCATRRALGTEEPARPPTEGAVEPPAGPDGDTGRGTPVPMPQKPAQASDLTPAEQAALVALRTPPSTDRWYSNDTEYNADRARAVVAAVRPRIWREVARWVRDTCEAYDDDRVCEDCTAQADLIVWHATDIESGRQTEGSGA